jgi:hypothetical protein
MIEYICFLGLHYRMFNVRCFLQHSNQWSFVRNTCFAEDYFVPVVTVLDDTVLITNSQSRSDKL